MNKTPVIIIMFCLAVLFGVPLFFQQNTEQVSPDAATVIIITPHNEQIRHEFAIGFSKWHLDTYGKEAKVVWSVPGGTSEIRRMLQSQFQHALETGDSPGGEADIVFGGGSYEHSVLKKPIVVLQDEKLLSTTISVPFEAEHALLFNVYEDEMIGDVPLFDSDGHWHGVALSGFGIVYNNDVLAELGVDAPTHWEALCNPSLKGHIALVNPAQSGSVTTAFEAILKNEGWDRGWQILRRAAANARYFSASSLKPPADVSQGDAAMGVCIDFYGRYQSQAIKSMGGGERIGYIDPPGATMIDPDPISLMRGAPNEVTARRFIEFCFTKEAQALWQFTVDDQGEDNLGPKTFELRRMPVRRELYRSYMDRMIDQVDPYQTATPAPYPDRNMRSFIAPLFAAMAMVNHDELAEAWGAIITHPAYPKTSKIVTWEDVENPELKGMLFLFDEMPTFETPEHDSINLQTKENRQIIKQGWLKNVWSGGGLWHQEESGSTALRKVASAFFQVSYDDIVKADKK